MGEVKGSIPIAINKCNNKGPNINFKLQTLNYVIIIQKAILWLAPSYIK